MIALRRRRAEDASEPIGPDRDGVDDALDYGEGYPHGEADDHLFALHDAGSAAGNHEAGRPTTGPDGRLIDLAPTEGEYGGAFASSAPGGEALRRALRDLHESTPAEEAATALFDLPPPSFRSSLLVVLLVDIALVIGLAAFIRPASVGSALLLLCALSVPFLFMTAFRPMVRRLALRNLIRRPGENAMMVLGLALGTAGITTAFVVDASFDRSIDRQLLRRLGPIDAIVVAPPGAPPPSEAVDGLDPALVDGVLALRVAPAAVVVPSGQGAPVVVGDAQAIEVDFSVAANFGGDPDLTGIRGVTPRPGSAVLTEDVAAASHLERGSPFLLRVAGTEQRLLVSDILPVRGISGFRLDAAARAANVFVAPGVLARVLEGSPSPHSLDRAALPRGVIAVSNLGGVRAGVRPSAAVFNAIESRLGPAVFTDGQVISGTTEAAISAAVIPVKAQLSAASGRTERRFVGLLGSVSGFTVLAGLLLLFALIVLIVQRRAVEHGTLRALGMRRGQLIATLCYEMWLLVLAAALLGTLFGVGAAAIVVTGARSFLDLQSSGSSVAFVAPAASLVAGFVTAVATTLAAATAAMSWVGAQVAVRAMQRVPPSWGARPSPRRPWMAAAIALAGLVCLKVGLGGNAVAVLLAPVLLGGAALAWLEGPAAIRGGRTRLAGGLAGLTLLWAVASSSAVDRVTDRPSPSAFAVQGALAVLAAATLVALAQPFLARGGAVLLRAFTASGRRLPWRRRAAARAPSGGRVLDEAPLAGLAAAHPAARRVRTTLVVAMFAATTLVISMVTALGTVLSGQERQALAATAGEYDLEVRSSLADPAPLAGLAGIPGVARVAAFAESTVEFALPPSLAGGTAVPSSSSSSSGAAAAPDGAASDGAGAAPAASATGEAATARPGRLLAIDDALASGGPALAAHDPQFADGPATLRAVAERADLAILSLDGDELLGRTPTIVPGTRLFLTDPNSGRTLTMTLAGITAAPLLERGDAVLAGRGAAQALRGLDSRPTRFWLDLGESGRQADVVDVVRRSYGSAGTEVRALRSVVVDRLAVPRQIARVLRSYLVLGLLVGALGLGLLSAQAVRERRREIALLKAFGVSGAGLQRLIVAEAVWVCLQGVVVGSVLGLFFARRLALTGRIGYVIGAPAVPVPVFTLLAVAVMAMAATAAAVLPAARRAANTAPADALR